MDETPDQFRRLAAKYRVMADRISDSRTFATLRELADDYERLADTTEADFGTAPAPHPLSARAVRN